MKKYLRFIVFIIMFLIIIAGAAALYTRQASGGNLAANPPTAYIEGTTINASFKIGGRITELLVEEGAHVKKGQVLARLESKELENKVAQAEAAVQLAEGKISEASGAKKAATVKESQGNQAVTITKETIESQIQQADATVKAAEANVQAVQAKVNSTKELNEIAATNYNRMMVLNKEGAAAQIQVDEAKSKMEQAKAEYNASKEQKKAAVAQLDQAKAALNNAIANLGKVDISKQDVEVANAAISQAEGAVQSAQGGKSQAKAALAEAKTYLEYTELIAPADGVIVTQSAQLGELVNTGFPIYTIETKDTRFAQFYFDETEIVDLKTGDDVTVELQASNERMAGKIKTISPVGDFAIKKATQSIGETDIRSFAVKVEFPDLSSDIPTGMTVRWVGKGELK